MKKRYSICNPNVISQSIQKEAEVMINPLFQHEQMGKGHRL